MKKIARRIKKSKNNNLKYEKNCHVQRYTWQNLDVEFPSIARKLTKLNLLEKQKIDNINIIKQMILIMIIIISVSICRQMSSSAYRDKLIMMVGSLQKIILPKFACAVVLYSSGFFSKSTRFEEVNLTKTRVK